MKRVLCYYEKCVKNIMRVTDFLKCLRPHYVGGAQVSKIKECSLFFV